MTNDKSKFLGLWGRIPLIVRAILLGFLVSTVGVLCWSVVATVIPMPWSFLLMALLLGVYIVFFSGRRWGEKTRNVRQYNFRRVRLNYKTWIIAIVAGLLTVFIEQSGLVVTFRLIDFPAERFTSEYAFLESVPLWAAWLVIAMISSVAGIIAHFIMDICNFSFWWSSIGWQFNSSTIRETGLDISFISWTVSFLVAISVFVIIIRKLKSSNPEIAPIHVH